MISSVVSTTASTVSSTSASTVSSVSSVYTSAGLGQIATMVLIALLIVKELAGARVESMGASGATLSQALDRVANVAIVPLLIVFGFIVVVQIMAVLH
jgi:hypothetical protein